MGLSLMSRQRPLQPPQYQTLSTKLYSICINCTNTLIHLQLVILTKPGSRSGGKSPDLEIFTVVAHCSWQAALCQTYIYLTSNWHPSSPNRPMVNNLNLKNAFSIYVGHSKRHMNHLPIYTLIHDRVNDLIISPNSYIKPCLSLLLKSVK